MTKKEYSASAKQAPGADMCPWPPDAPSNHRGVFNDLRHVIVYRDPNSLKPPLHDIVANDQRLIDQTVERLLVFGANDPIAVDRNGHIVVGYHIWHAARQAGLDEVPVVEIGHLDEAELAVYSIGEVKTGQDIAFNEQELGKTLADLWRQDLAFDFSLTNLSIADMDNFIALASEDEEAERDDHLAAVTGEPITRPGDLFELGPHRVFCGDSRDVTSFDKVMRDEKAGFAFADPPYNNPITGHAMGRGRHRHKDFAMASGEYRAEEYEAFLKTTTANMAQFTVDGGVNLISIDWRHVGELLAAGKVSYSAVLNLIVWVKSNGGMGSHYRSQHELILMFKVGKSRVVNNVQLGRNGRNRTNVWHYPGLAANTKDRNALLAMHPTVKPVALVADAILDSSKRGDIILDPFGGSGTTLIAAAKTGRRARLIEIDPLYIDATITRWQTWSGEKAVLVATGQTFDQIAADRRARDAVCPTNADGLFSTVREVAKASADASAVRVRKRPSNLT